MVQLGMIAAFKFNVLEWYSATVHTKKLLFQEIGKGKTNITNLKIQEVAIQTEKLQSTK